MRIPGSINSKNNAEVKIIQEWDGHRPDFRLLLGSFYAYLVGQKRQQRKDENIGYLEFVPGCDYGPVTWIEKLLQTPIEDYRKHARDLILVPYLLLRRRITDPEQICDIVMQWADKCAELRRLDPSRREFECEVRTRIQEVERDKIQHMSFERLKEKNPDLYETLKLGEEKDEENE